MCASTTFLQTGIRGHRQPPFLFSLLFPHVFADQLNATGISQLPSLHLASEEEAESEEGEDYY